jgi:amino acid adenylation domain-containing protein/non-ribosomal peptide synthase protein (TIGR01720 family)
VDVTQALKRVAQENGATLFMTLLSGFKTLLARYSGQQEIIIGSPIAGRTSAELERLIGFFVNTLVLRTDLAGDPSFRELLARVRENTLGAYAHQDVPFEMLVDVLAPERSRNRNPLFQAGFVLQNAPLPALELPGLRAQVEESDSGTSKFDLTLVTQETAEGLAVCFEYSTDLFDESTIARMSEHLKTLLSAIANDPERRISELPLMTAQELNTVVREWNHTETPFLANSCLHDLFLDQVRRTPDSVALEFGDQHLSYAELNARANRIAGALTKLGFGPESLAAIALPRSTEMIAAILGALKAGGAWMPVAVDQPADRIAFMLNDACPQVIISNSEERGRLPQAAQRFRALDIDDAAVKNENDAVTPHGAKAGNLAYVIYTSGSTGRPKGVMVEHRGACNLAFAQAKLFGISAGTRVLQFAAPTFDAAVSEIFVTLVNGGTLVLARREQLIGQDLAELLKQAEVEVATVPPSILATLPEAELPKLRTLVTAGEACPAELARRWSAGRDMINAYGPTEATVCATAGNVDGNGRITIGRPIDNVRVYIVDAMLRPVPIGVAGELLIGGAGVARGYLQRPELTHERFVMDPFSGETDSRLYRTGDRARFLEDGSIEYLGRSDRQMKIRGFRIEPGEIEAALLGQSPVREAIVIDREDTPGHRRLVAYVTARDNSEIRAAELRASLAGVLPEYMLPSAIVVLPALPLTAHGKIDRPALPAPERGDARKATGDAEARTATEQRFAEIWRQVLGVSEIGVNDNFFELGGDSILTIQVVTRAREAGLNITPRDLFDHQTIATLSAAAEQSEAATWEQNVAPGPVPLTPIQKWFFEQLLADAHHWNQSVLLKMTDAPDTNAMEGAVNAVIAHHDALRLRFKETASGWAQEITAADAAVTVPVFDLSDLHAGARESRMEEIASGIQSSFNLAEPPLLKAALFNLGNGGWRLLITAHHLSVDGVSWRILLEDLHTAYEQLRNGGTVRLAMKTASVRQWAEALIDRANAPEMAAEAEYWRSVVCGEAARLPVDWPATPAENTRDSCETLEVRLSQEETTQLLREVPKAYRSQINDALLTALSRAVQAWTGQRSVLVNLESHGRDAVSAGPDVSRTVGWFTSAYPVRVELPASGDPGESLKAVKEQLRRVPRNGAGYGLLRYLSMGEISRELAEAPEPEIGFNYLGQFDQSFAQATAFSMATEGRGLEHSPSGRRTNLLEFNGNVSGGQLHFSCVYSRLIHDRATVERLLRGFAKELRTLIAHCAAPDAGGFTPSDFPLAQLNERNLGKLARLIARPVRGKVSATL